MSVLKFATVAIAFLCLVSSFIAPIALAEVSQDPVASTLADAESAVGSSYQAVLEAGDAGAEVTLLLSQLNYAADLLAQAEIAYRNGDVNTAVEMANSAVPIASEVLDAAVTAKNEALVADQTALLSAIAFSVVGSVVFVLVLFAVWRFFKRSYVRNLLDKRPEVSSQ